MDDVGALFGLQGFVLANFNKRFDYKIEGVEIIIIQHQVPDAGFYGLLGNYRSI